MMAMLCLLCSAGARAQELLLNRSFESPVAPANGNNFYVTMPNWTVTAINNGPTPVNLVRPWSGYSGNPVATPTGGGSQYFDINSDAGTIRQTVTVSGPGVIDFSLWYSVRDSPQALTGLTVNIRNSSNAIVATASTSFAASDPIGLWKQASRVNVPVSAGTYVFEAVIPDSANVDLASMVFKPALRIAKSSIAWSDPVNGTSLPKQIPGGLVQYDVLVTNPGTIPVTANSVIVGDATPANMSLFVGDIAGAGSGPAQFIQGGPSSALTYVFTALGSASDDIEFSNNGGASWTYTPVADANGVDAMVTHVRMRPKGTMAANSSFTLRLRYRIR